MATVLQISQIPNCGREEGGCERAACVCVHVRQCVRMCIRSGRGAYEHAGEKPMALTNFCGRNERRTIGNSFSFTERVSTNFRDEEKRHVTPIIYLDIQSRQK